METLEPFSGVSLEKLTRKEVEGVEFLLPTAEQFLAIYRSLPKILTEMIITIIRILLRLLT